MQNLTNILHNFRNWSTILVTTLWKCYFFRSAGLSSESPQVSYVKVNLERAKTSRSNPSLNQTLILRKGPFPLLAWKWGKVNMDAAFGRHKETSCDKKRNRRKDYFQNFPCFLCNKSNRRVGVFFQNKQACLREVLDEFCR